MKSVFLFSLLSIIFTNATYAQLTKSQESYIEKQVYEALAKEKKAKEKEVQKERKRAQRHERQRIEHEANFYRQMDNLNQYNADDFLSMPQQQGKSSATNYGNGFHAAKNTEEVPKAHRKEGERIRSNRNITDEVQNSGGYKSPWENGNISMKGTDYIKNQELYNTVHKFDGGYPANQGQQQIKRSYVSPNDLRKQYLPEQNEGTTKKTMLRGEQKPARVMNIKSSQTNNSQPNGKQSIRLNAQLQHTPVKENCPVQQQIGKRNEDIMQPKSFPANTESIRKDKNGRVLIERTSIGLPRNSNSSAPAVVDINSQKNTHIINKNQAIKNIVPYVGSLTDDNNDKLTAGDYMKANKINGLTPKKMQQEINAAIEAGNMDKLRELTDMGSVEMKWPSRIVRQKRK